MADFELLFALDSEVLAGTIRASARHAVFLYRLRDVLKLNQINWLAQLTSQIKTGSADA